MTIERELGCSTTRWRFDVTSERAEELADAHARFGGIELTSLGATRSFSIGPHKLLIVTTTGRGQVRLNTATPTEHRSAAAQAVWRSLVEVLPFLESDAHDAASFEP